MRFENSQKSTLRQWMLSRLNTLEDTVDPEVLTDLVFTLLHSEKPLNLLRDEVLENLGDILEDACEPFVQDLFQELSRLTPSASSLGHAVSVNPFTESTLPYPRKREINTSSHEKFKNDHTTGPPPQFETANLRWRSVLPQTKDNDTDTPQSSPRSKSADRTRKEEIKHVPESKSSPAPPQIIPFDLQPDPNDPSYPMRHASFMLMQQNFPYLTQLWMNNILMQKQAELDQSTHGVEEDSPKIATTTAIATVETQPTNNVTTNKTTNITKTQHKCHDFETTGLCIRGDACPNTHIPNHTETHTQLDQHTSKHKQRHKNKNKHTSRSKTSHKSTHDHETRHIHPSRTRQIQLPNEPDTAGDGPDQRVDLVRKPERLDQRLQVEKNRLMAKLAVQRRGRAGKG